MTYRGDAETKKKYTVLQFAPIYIRHLRNLEKLCSRPDHRHQLLALHFTEMKSVDEKWYKAKPSDQFRAASPDLWDVSFTRGDSPSLPNSPAPLSPTLI